MVRHKLMFVFIIGSILFINNSIQDENGIHAIQDQLESFDKYKRKLSYRRFLMETSIMMAPNECYSVSDGTDQLYTIDKFFGSPIFNIGPTGVSNIEAITTSVDGTTIYGFNDATWGTINPTTGNFTGIGNVGTGDGAQGTVNFNDVDGVAIDARTLEYFGSERQNDGSPDDLLFQFDPLTGNIILDAFGPGVDYVVIATSSIPVSPTLYDVDDMGVDPLNGDIYAVTNTAGTNDRLIKVNRLDGSVTDVGRITNLGVPINDIESMSFSNDGTLFITSATTNRFYSMSKLDATTTLLGTFPSGSDFEGIACLTDGANSVAGTVFYDYDYSATYNAGDAPSPGETVYLYEDINGDGILDFGDELLQVQLTDASGDYLFQIGIEGDFIVSINATVHIMTTPDEIAMTFVGVGTDLVDHDFGYVCGKPIAVDDYDNTLIDTPVDVDVLANDLACSGLDPSTVTTTGVMQPTNGTITGINGTTGEITYLPLPGYTGIDSFEYIVCDLAPVPLCDTATVYITIACTGTSGQNDMSGSVYIDANENLALDTGELGQSGVTVYLYEDNSPNDLIPDGPPVQSMVTNASGAYLFTVNHTYSASGSGTYVLTNGSHDARERDTGQTEINRSNHRITDNGRDLWNGFRFNNITIPTGATITSAVITFTAHRSHSNTVASTRFYGQDNTSNPAVFINCNNCNNITSRARTSATVDWINLSGWSQGNTYASPDLSNIVQEIVDDQLGLTNAPIVMITQSLGPDYQQRRAVAYDNSPSNAAKLSISYVIPGNEPYNYVIKIDETTIPAGYSLTTDNLEVATFNFDGISDCNNDFGIVLPYNCPDIYTNGFIRYNRLE